MSSAMATLASDIVSHRRAKFRASKNAKTLVGMIQAATASRSTKASGAATTVRPAPNPSGRARLRWHEELGIIIP